MDWFPPPYWDETIYSLLARLRTYLGEPSTASFSRAITGGRHWVAVTQLPCQLDALADHFGLDSAFVDRLIDQHSLLPFYTAFASAKVRLHAREAMRGSADGLHFTLGMSTSPVPAPTHLRFCPLCQAEMLRDHGEMWWRRIHQLPGIFACAVHGAPLRNSAVEFENVSRHDLVAASEQVCLPDAEPSRNLTCSAAGQRKLVKLARAAEDLLVSPPAPAEFSDLYNRRLKALANARFIRGTCQVRFGTLTDHIRRYWHDALAAVPGLAIDETTGLTWIEDHVRNRRKLAHPLRHIVVDRAISAAAIVERPFGPGPWPCLNPIAGHFGKPVIQNYRQLRDKGKLHGRFTCECGYSYSVTRQVDGNVGPPRFREFGPSLGEFLPEQIRLGTSLRNLSRRVGLDPKSLVREALSQGISLRWSLRPSGKVNFQVEPQK